MKKFELNLKEPVFIVMNHTRMSYGITNDITQSSKAAMLRKTDKHSIYRVTDIHKFPLTEDALDFQKNGGLSYDFERDGYKPGDLLRPWVTQYGSIIARGEMHKLVGDEWQPLNELGRPISNAALKAVKALKVLLLTPGIREFLDDNDPKAVEQAIDAVHENGYTLPKRQEEEDQ